MCKKLSAQIPQIGTSMVSYKGKEIINAIGDNVIKEVVTSILCGGNIRSLTEGLTRRRLSISNASLLVTFIKSINKIDNFISDIPKLVNEELLSDLSKDKKLFLQWFIGLTGKSIQNVLRSSNSEFKVYLSDFENSIKESVNKCSANFGTLKGVLKLNDEECPVDWQFVLFLFLAIGAQTLSIRGSEKSTYGKLFEKLILGSLLSILGFDKSNPDDTSKTDRVFWLSSRGSKRESDATLLIKPGVGVRFDLGFIGPGNTEISLDKVSRFEREMQYGKKLYYMSTIILVDRIGERSRIVEMAKAIHGDIVQMSMTNWVKDVYSILSSKAGYRHKIAGYSNSQLLSYIKKSMNKVNLNDFI